MLSDGPISARNLHVPTEFTVVPSLQYATHRDWGDYYKRRGQLSLATEHFETAFQINKAAFIPLLERSRCAQFAGQLADAVAKADECLALYPDTIAAHNQRTACIYDDNQFEQSLSAYYNTFYEKHTKHPTDHHDIETGASTIHRAIAPPGCLLNIRTKINRLQSAKHKQHQTAEGEFRPPMWKILRDNNDKCDVFSLDEKREHLLSNYYRPNKRCELSPLEQRRRDLNLRLKHTMYLHPNTTKDIQLLQSLMTDERLNLRQTAGSAEQMRNTISKHCAQIDQIEDMLYKREPFHARHAGPNGRLCAENKRIGLQRLQAQARRDSFNFLATVKQLYAAGNVAPMFDFIEQIMTDYFPLKTLRILPRKWEIMDDIYNIAGMAYMRKLVVPPDLLQLPHSRRMAALLQIPIEHKHTGNMQASKEFGVRKPKLLNSYVRYRRECSSLESRLRYSSYPLERCYLFYKIANLHVAERNLDEAVQMGKHMLEQALLCDNKLWEFLSLLVIVRAKSVLGQLGIVQKKLSSMYDMKDHLDTTIRHFVQTAIKVNECLVEIAAMNDRKISL